MNPNSPSRQVSGEPSLVQLLLGLAGLVVFGAIAFTLWQATQVASTRTP